MVVDQDSPCERDGACHDESMSDERRGLLAEKTPFPDDLDDRLHAQLTFLVEIDQLNAKSGALQAEIDSYRHRIDLFQTTKLDPDLVSERARALLSMAQADDIVVMVDPGSGKPVMGSSAASTEDQLSGIIEDGID